MIDKYTKGVLTVIAVTLVTIAAQNFTNTAIAQLGNGCGGISDPCYVKSGFPPLEVRIAR